MLALVERFPDLGQDLAKYVMEREQNKGTDTTTSITDNAEWLVRCRRLHCQLCGFVSAAADALPCHVVISLETVTLRLALRCAIEQKRQKQNMLRIEELATAADPTAFKAAFRSRRRSVPDMSAGDVSGIVAYGSSGD